MLSVMDIFVEGILSEAEGTTIDMGTPNKGQVGKLDGNVQSALDEVLKTSLNPTSKANGVSSSNKWVDNPGAVSTGVDNSINQENLKF